MIEIRNVTKTFHELVAVNNVSLHIPRGEVIGLLGPNGAGKTTLLKLIAGLLKPDRGQIHSLTASWPAIGYKPERLIYPQQMRIREYLEMVAILSNIARQDLRRVVDVSLARLQLTESADQRVKHCSKGMRQRLGLAQALIGAPPLLLLDEPSNGLDPDGQREIVRLVQEMQALGKTIILSSHQLEEVTQMCTRLVILNQGRVHYERAMSEALQERPYSRIQANRDLAAIGPLLAAIHPDIQVEGDWAILQNEAIKLRRQILSIILSAGFDILRVERRQVTLAEIYAQTVKK